MSGRTYLGWFLAVVAAAVLAIIAFNALSDRYILGHPAGPSVQTVSGFERVLKPAWIDTLKPEMVFAGSSRMREGFDPAIIDPALGVHSFNYGLSSITAYEARRLLQDSLAQPTVKTIFMSMDAFGGGSAAQPVGSGFDETRLAVTADGAPTPRRALWLATTRYLSGGAFGMHALSDYLLAQLKPGQPAAERPDLFNAYSRMTSAGLRKDLTFRFNRTMTLTPWQRGEFDAALAALCPCDVKAVFFFPPDHFAMIERYMANDTAGLLAFKRTALADVQRHNAQCRSKVALFDFLTLNAITGESIGPDGSTAHLDLIHFRPPVGLRLLHTMLGKGEPLGVDLAMAPDADARIEHLRADVAAWRAAHASPAAASPAKVSGSHSED
ncbi:MAG TPA: hypothetical protein VHL34_21685 [Rhizomicrobium sp.]|jgi:hypothetical protein|nr:hypothetical protein [Rhizomicrobium sp.]